VSVTVHVTPAAARDVAAALAHYAPHDRADDFLAAVDRALANIAEHPSTYPVVHQDVRRALLRRFPYSVFFVVEPERAVVLAVHHQRRDPAARPRR
jgi:plasmid stabilization system protein ParE